MTETQTETQVQGGGSGGDTPVVTTGFPDDITRLGDTLAGLTMKQAVDLQGYLKDTHGIVAPEGGGQVEQTKPVVIEKEPEKTTFDVILKGAGEKKINVIKEVRTITGLGLKEAKEFVEKPGQALRENVTKEEAEKIKKLITDAGGEVEIK